MGEEVMRNPPISPGPPSGLSGRGTIGVESSGGGGGGSGGGGEVA